MRLPKSLVMVGLVLNTASSLYMIVSQWSFLWARSEGEGPVMRLVGISVPIGLVLLLGYGPWRHWRVAEAFGAIVYGYVASVMLSRVASGRVPWWSDVVFVLVVLMVAFFIVRLLERRAPAAPKGGGA